MRIVITLSFCLTFLATVALAQCPQYDFSHIASGFELDCNNSTIAVQAIIDGDPPAAILWTRNGNVYGTDNDIAIHQDGTYNLIVTGQDGCVESTPFLVTATALGNLPTELVLQGCFDDPELNYCLEFWMNDWQITWSDGSTGPCISGVAVGELHTATISNVDCTEEITFEIPEQIFVATVMVSQQNCETATLELLIEETSSYNDFTVSFMDSQGDVFSYELENTNVLSFELPAGDYTGTVTNSLGCSVETNAFSVNASGVEISDVVTVDVNCNGESDGSIELFLEGGQEPYTISWSNGQTGNSTIAENLSAGPIEVTVVDANNCTTTASLGIEEPSPIVLDLVEFSPASCENGNDGFLQVEATGGVGVLTFAWSNGWDTGLNTGLEAGDYTLTVIDENGCTVSETYTVESGFDVFVDWTNDGNITCINSEVTLIANPSGPDYSYAWTGGDISGQTTSGVTVNEPGTYTVLITNVNDPTCFGVGSYVVEEFTEEITANLTVSGGGCTNQHTIDIEVTSGDMPMVLTVSQENNPILTFAIDDPFTTLENFQPGTYEIGLRSIASGCLFEEVIVVEPTSTLAVNIEGDMIACDNELTMLTAIATDGAAPYEYLWTTGEITETINVPAGVYCVTVTDQESCSVEACFNNVVEPLFTIFEYEFASCGQADGGIYPFTSGGIPPYTYEWAGGITTEALEDVAAGVYQLTITDANGCTLETSAELSEELNLIVSSTSPADLCNGGEVTVSVSPVIDGYIYHWEGPNGFTFTGTSFVTTTNGLYSVEAIGSGDDCDGLAFFDLGDAEGILVGVSVVPLECEEATLLIPTFSANVDFNELTSRWVLPNGDTINTAGGLMAQETGRYVYLGDYASFGCQVSDTIFLQSLGLACDGVSGTLWADEGNCLLDGTETPVPGWIVRIETDQGVPVTYIQTDDNGGFTTTLAPGDYLAYPSPWNDDLYYDCPNPQAFTVDAAGNGFVNVFMPYEEECATMYVNVAAPVLRRCFENEIFVYYCNDGSIVAEDATVSVELDPFLIFIDANQTPASVDAHTVTFELGNLAPFECGYISMTVLASCEAELGQTHCIEATATPNDPCPNPSNWNGANLSVQGNCDGDSLTFTITNDGTLPLSQSFQYIVIEDGIMMMSSPVTVPALNAGESLEVSVAANGSTYHFQTTQEAGNPGFENPTLVVEGCGTNSQGTFTTGLVNLLPLGDASTDWYDIFCRDNTGSYDPNEKTGLPIGVGEQHFIEEGTMLSYDIEFQNTGTDTAFTVVIRDTIAPEFDLATLRMGASSHDYTFLIDSNRTLVITFNDIMLPDSNVDLRGSQGIVSYTISHVEGIPLGTQLKNQAAIYFDFNEPIFTSTTLHTLGEDFLSSLVEVGQTNEVAMSIYPNPVGKQRQINVQLDIDGLYLLEVYNSLGVKVVSQNHQQGAGFIDLGKQPAGWYIARAIRPDGRFIALTRFIVE